MADQFHFKRARKKRVRKNEVKLISIAFPRSMPSFEQTESQFWLVVTVVSVIHEPLLIIFNHTTVSRLCHSPS